MDKASITRVVLAIVALVKLFGVDIHAEVIDAVVDVIASMVVMYTVYKNNYISGKGKRQKEVLDKNGLS